MISEYQEFLARKSPADAPSGLSVVPPLSPALKPFQAAITSWALRRGRAAIFAGTGLGKTLMQLIWAHEVVNATGKPVLILCPLAVAEQTVAEANKFGVPFVGYAADQSQVAHRITVTNYERFEKFDIASFVGIVLDESGIIKAEDGKTRKMLTEACRLVPWRLCCTATPSPNDYTELGQHSEFLGVMDAKEMLAMFFVHDGSIRAGDATQGHDGWRMKRHAANDFWRWLASWSVMVRHPRDLGFDEPGYDLPPLNLHQVTVAAEYKPTAGELFPMMANTLSQRIGVRRDTADQRCDCAVNIIDSDPESIKLSACYQMKPKNDARQQPVNAMRRTQSEGPQSKQPQLSPESPRPEKLTCELTTPLTRKNSDLEIQNNESDTTLQGEQDTPKTLYLENGSRNKPSNPPRYIEKGISESLASRQINTMKCLPPKVVDVQSVAQRMVTNLDADSPSIIATIPDMSEGFSVPTVITGSESSEIIETYLQEQSNISVNSGVKWIVWCQLDKEQHQIAKRLGDRCFSIYGSLPNDDKISRMRRWLAGERSILISKPKIFGYGMNLQCCHKMVFVGATDSFEQTYQAVRRCWRFGQTRPVDVYFIASELEGNVVANLKRKELAFDAMLDAMSVHMTDLMRENVIGGRNATVYGESKVRMELPTWI